MIGFLGPWFCSLLFNTSTKCKKQTHLVAHTYPHLTVDALNKNTSTNKRKRKDDEDCWVIIIKVGPFCEWDHATTYLNLWMLHTRGKACRLERGLMLYQEYKEQYGLKMWTQTANRSQLVATFFAEDAAVVVSPMRQGFVGDVQNEDDENDERYDNGGGKRTTLDQMLSTFQNVDLKEVNVGDIKQFHTQIEAASSIKAKTRAKTHTGGGGKKLRVNLE